MEPEVMPALVVERVEYKILYNTAPYENIELRASAIIQPGQDPAAAYTALRSIVEDQAQAEKDRRAQVAAEREARYLAEQNARYERARAQREAAAGNLDVDDELDDDDKPF